MYRLPQQKAKTFRSFKTDNNPSALGHLYFLYVLKRELCVVDSQWKVSFLVNFVTHICASVRVSLKTPMLKEHHPFSFVYYQKRYSLSANGFLLL